MSQNNPNNGENKQTSSNDKANVSSRRSFLKNSGIAAGGVVGGVLLGGLVNNPFQTEETSTTKDNSSKELLQEARTFFSRKDDFETLAAATERIYPKNDNGPGAIELAVPYFIDKQLAGSWGSNHKEYRKGPFDPSRSDTHGLQEKLNRGEMFLAGLRRMQELSQKEHDAAFFDIDNEQQDKILQDFEAGDVKIKGMRSDTFFDLLRTTTLEGVYSDPAYGGNKDMQGWKMIEYPGPRMGWMNDIDAEEFLSKEPQSLRQYQGGDA